ncbi:MAG: hypothetical protein [Olavius algarvensis Gamma 3 endosymbiont]|nr:MAG: hypothetical protein [Olavius algarvensis Gamma 3 endosymbiont]
MKKLNRRQFLGSTAAIVAFTPSILIANRSAVAGDAARVDPNDPQAKALSYVHESPKADNLCTNCQLYQGAADAAWGLCAIFPGKQVAGGGWCSAWVKKAG